MLSGKAESRIPATATGRASAAPGRMIAREEWAPDRRSGASHQGRSAGEGGSSAEPDAPLREPRSVEPGGTAATRGIGLTAPYGTETASTCAEPPAGAGRRAAASNRPLRKPATPGSNPWRASPPARSPVRLEQASSMPDSGVPGRGSRPPARRSRPGFPPAVSDARFPRLDRCSNRSGSGCRRQKGPQ